MTTTTEAQPQPGWPHARKNRTATPPYNPLLTRTKARCFSLQRSLIVFVVAIMALLVLDMALFSLHPGTYRSPIGNYRDVFFLQGAHFQEVAPDGETYRWTQGTSSLRLIQTGVVPSSLLTLDVGGRPAPGEVQLDINEEPWLDITAQPESRRYTFLLPPNLPGEVTVGLQSETFTTPGDPRGLGFKLESFALTMLATGPPLPPLPLYLVQVVLILAVQGITLRLGGGWRIQAVVVALLVVALALVASQMLLLAYVYTARLAVAGCVLAALTWIALPLIERHMPWLGNHREIRLLWAMMLLICLVRFVGVFYPTFGAQDLNRNLNRLATTIQGDLVIIAWSGEFADGDTIYPPGPYLAVMPGLTLTDDRSAVLQGTLALLDGTTALFVAMLTRRLGGTQTATRLAMLLYMSNIAVFGAMTYGFSAQIFGQWLTAPLALLLLVPGGLARPRTWGLATLLLLVAVLSHIGVAILGITWFGVLLGLLVLFRFWNRGLAWGIGLFVASGLLAFGLLYVHIFQTTVGHLGTVAQDQSSFALEGNTPLLWKGMRLAYSAIGLVLLPLGVLLLIRTRLGLEQRVVTLAWGLTTLLYFVVDLVTALQVRYFYFSLPLAMAVMALLLGRLAQRGRWGRVAAWALVLVVAIPNILLWYSATMADGKISMTPLTH